MKRNLIILLTGLFLVNAKPIQENKGIIHEMDISYFLDNYYKPKNEIWVCYFWATWCMNCVQSHHVLEGLDNEFKNQHVRLISLSLDANKSKWKTFIEEHPANWDQVYAADTPFDKRFRSYFGHIKNLPQLFIIKRDGKAHRVKYLSQLKSELQKTVEE